MKILLISYYFPPYNSVGAIRPGRFARFLHERGHDVTVISGPQPFPKGIDLEIPVNQVHYPQAHSLAGSIQKFIRSIDQASSTGHRSVDGNGNLKDWLKRQVRYWLFWPDAQRGWVKTAFKTGCALMREQRFDLIYCSAPSFSGLRVAHKLHQRFSVPWIAEYRDLWTDNHYFSSPFPKAVIEKYWERSILTDTSAIVTVSQPLADIMRKHDKPVWVIKNGFDPQEFACLPDKPKDAEHGLNIVFTGNVYKQNNDLDCLCQGIKQFIVAGGDAKLSVAGRNIAPLIKAAQRTGIANHVDCKYLLERQQALRLQKSADVLVLFLWGGGNQGIAGTKLYEYSGAKNPILAIGSKENDQAAIIGEAGLGDVAENPEQVARCLKAWQREKEKNGQTLFRQKQDVDFTRAHQFRMLEAQLLEMIEKN